MSPAAAWALAARWGSLWDPAAVEKVYRMEDKSVQRRLRELVEQIPLEHLR